MEKKCLVTNKTGQKIIAYCWRNGFGEKGKGDDFIIKPGKTTQVIGAIFDEWDKYRIPVSGNFICQDGPDDDNGYQVILGKPLTLPAGKEIFLEIRHHYENRKGEIKIIPKIKIFIESLVEKISRIKILNNSILAETEEQ